MKILAIIPARSGSKSIPHKNIKSLNGKPLIGYSIEHALKSKLINRTIVSTDSLEYAEIAKSYGAEVPFIRPSEISMDLSKDIEFFQHALLWLKENENYIPDICVQLRPTHPIRNIEDIDNMLDLLIKNPDADSVRSVVHNKSHIPYKMWFINEDNELLPVIINKNFHEAYNMPRQELPMTYFQNASIDVIRTSTILEKNSMSGDKILGYIMDEEFDIDYEADFEAASRRLAKDSLKNNNEKKTYCFDIDGVIANLTPVNDYSKATPISNNIKLINQLFEQGHFIILFTARGSKTGIDWSELTKKQMNEWNVKYHELKFGKPAADYYIDDRNLFLNDLINK